MLRISPVSSNPPPLGVHRHERRNALWKCKRATAFEECLAQRTTGERRTYPLLAGWTAFRSVLAWKVPAGEWESFGARSGHESVRRDGQSRTEHAASRCQSIL